MVDHFRPGAAAIGSTTVEISVSCKNLADMDVFSKSDPMCVLYVKETGRDQWYEFGRTEVIQNNLNPEFAKKFVMNYFFEERQHLRFEIYDIDSPSPDLTKHDFIGRADVTLGEVVSVGRLERRLIGGPLDNNGTIILVGAEEIAACKEEVTFHFEGKKLDKKDLFGKSDPYLALYKVNEDNTYTVVHRSEVIKNTLNPTWQPFTIPLRSLCGGDYSRSILIRCFDWNRNGKEDLIGEFVTNLQALMAGSNVFFELINPKLKQKKDSYKTSGTLLLKSIRIRPIVTFLDYVQAGTQLNCTIGIDFTASNGDPTKASSLHHIHPYVPNQYHRALMAVGEIIQDYDSDKLFPVLGFGARLPPDGKVSHEFFVNGHPSNPYCEGIDGVVQAYHQCLRGVQLYGPTNFANVINHVARFAAAKRNGSEYFILLIITDGVITDMPQTKEAIVNASMLPLSIIIVGVGDADFEAMRELDGDTVRLSAYGRFAERDIVQFVPFREFVRGRDPADWDVAQARLAKEVLAEIPEQFMSYMKKNIVAPGSWNTANGTGASRRISAPPIPPKHGTTTAIPSSTAQIPALAAMGSSASPRIMGYPQVPSNPMAPASSYGYLQQPHPPQQASSSNFQPSYGGGAAHQAGPSDFFPPPPAYSDVIASDHSSVPQSRV